MWEYVNEAAIHSVTEVQVSVPTLGRGLISERASKSSAYRALPWS